MSFVQVQSHHTVMLYPLQNPLQTLQLICLDLSVMSSTIINLCVCLTVQSYTSCLHHSTIRLRAYLPPTKLNWGSNEQTSLRTYRWRLGLWMGLNQQAETQGSFSTHMSEGAMGNFAAKIDK